jgi:hypothetical protein
MHKEPHPDNIEILVDANHVTYDIQVRNIRPDGRFENPYGQNVLWGTFYLIRPYGSQTVFDQEFSPSESLLMLPIRLSEISPWHEDLHVQPYDGKHRMWDVIGIIQLVDIYKARVVEWSNQPRDPRLRTS